MPDDAGPGHASDDAAAPGRSSGEVNAPDLSDGGGDASDRASDTAGDTRADAPGTATASRTADVSAYTTGVRGISPRVQVQWILRLFVGVAVLAAVGGWIAPRAGVDPGLVLAGVGGLVALGLVWVHLRYRVWSYHLRDDALYLERGVLTHVRTVAPHVRIQHVDTSRSPLERALGLSTLVVYTAGSRGADVSVPGLTPGEAGDLQRRLKELAIESEGGDAL